MGADLISLSRAGLARVRDRIAAACARAGRPADAVRLVAVTKYAEDAEARALWEAGATDLAESRVQDAQRRIPAFPPGPTWHLVGALQSNKANRAAELFSVLHSLDREELADRLDRRLAALDRTMEAYLQVNVAHEPQKHGAAPEAVPALLDHVRRSCPRVRVVGLMTMAPHGEEAEASRPVFRDLAKLARELGVGGLSMGMTADFEVAIEEGATVVRIGEALVAGLRKGSACPA